MAFFSAKFLGYSRVSFLAFVSYKLLTEPGTVLEYSGVMVLASAMNLPLLMVNDNSPIYGSLAVLLFTLAFTDFLPLVDDNTQYLELAAPARLLFFFVLAIYTCMGSNIYICNSLVFVYCFFEIWTGILIYSTTREEKMKRLQEIEKAEEELQEQYQRGELNDEQTAKVEKELEKAEIDKLMQEFQ
ncbi:unnamed protein product [Ambrosiozyma monospora]|uniref:Unnamed protein product n=1 Tax=Ambrosiozyma monospora TaxID=43982 RepID=A0A9W6YWZ3_AMBMO|nr:unnamed protein product [Ambrosiozyma monospora]